MKLTYHTGNNFGDKLNPYIFERIMPNTFDDDESIIFVGIGSILGFEKVKRANKKVVFSSGYSYMDPPEIDNSWDILCVRGPLTAETLNINEKYAICDGAILLSQFNYPSYNKKFNFSYMPHVGSERYFDWGGVCSEVGYNFISPTEDTESIIRQVMQSRVLFSEAMHGAIVADALRTPWVAVKSYRDIDDFKWRDWAQSVELPYNPVKLPSMFRQDIIYNKILKRVRGNSGIAKALSKIYYLTQSKVIRKKFYRDMENLRNVTPLLSDDGTLERNCQLLAEKLSLFKEKYC